MSFLKAKAIVIYAPIKDADTSVPVHPVHRHIEIQGCNSDKTRIEKYLVWRLLEYTVKNYTTLDFANLQFAKTDGGKWVCPDFYFSLSHTDGLVCVALSDEPIGVDAEVVRAIRPELRARILTEREMDAFMSIPEEQQSEYLLKAWVRKESIFKKDGGTALLPGSIEATEHTTALKRVTVGTREYLISVCHTRAENIEFNYVEEI